MLNMFDGNRGRSASSPKLFRKFASLKAKQVSLVSSLLTSQNSITPPSGSYQPDLLYKAFPKFPKKMMDCLIVQYEGNYRKIYKMLTSKGWDTSIDRRSFSNKADPHLTTRYYFGIRTKDSTAGLLENCPTGSYLTYYRYVGELLVYFLKYKNTNGDIVECRISRCFLYPETIQLTNLKHPLVNYDDVRDMTYIPPSV